MDLIFTIHRQKQWLVAARVIYRFYETARIPGLSKDLDKIRDFNSQVIELLERWENQKNV